jgi:uncharacterized protein
LSIDVDDSTQISGVAMLPLDAVAGFVFAHGAGAGMTHPFMEKVAAGLFERGIATLRYQFPYMEKGSKRPDTPGIAHAAVRAAVNEARQKFSRVPLIAGGKSFGGRMTSQMLAAGPLPDVDGLAFLGFPLHPPGKPSTERASHLADIRIPMLFVQGTRDKLAELPLLEAVVKKLRAYATLSLVQDADHSFHVAARSGRTDRDAMDDFLDAFARWTTTLKPVGDTTSARPG